MQRISRFLWVLCAFLFAPLAQAQSLVGCPSYDLAVSNASTAIATSYWCQNGENCVIVWTTFSPTVGEWRLYSNGGATNTSGGYNCTGWTPPPCTANSQEYTGSAGLLNSSGEFCNSDDNCVYKSRGPAFEFGQQTFGTFSQTGATCSGGSNGDPDADDCLDTGGGYQMCVDGNQVCVKTPSGNTYCYTQTDSPQCDVGSTDAACLSAGPPPPEENADFEEDGPRINVDWSGNDNDSDEISTYIRRPDSDGDGDPDEDDTDDDNDGTDDEEDDEEPTRTATLTGCGSQPACDGDPIDCAHYITSWRNYCKGHGDTAAGGADCGTAPTCTGDPIQCAQLSQTWRLRCDFDSEVKGGTTCASPPECTGDPLRCGIIKQQWLLRCDASEVSGGESCDTPPTCQGDEAQCAMVETLWAAKCQGTVSGGEVGQCDTPPSCDPNSAQCASVKALWRLDCATNGPELPSDAELFGPEGTPGQGVEVEDAEDVLAGLDDGGYGWSRTCPTLGNAQMMGVDVALDSPLICDGLAILAAFILLGAYAQAFYIIGRG